MHIDEEGLVDQWKSHIQEMVEDLGTCVRSLELLDPSSESIAVGDAVSLAGERHEIRELLCPKKCGSSKIVYGGDRYVFVRRQDDASLEKPFCVLVSLDTVRNQGKRGMLVADYYGMVLVATFDNERMAGSVNSIVKYISATEECEG